MKIENSKSVEVAKKYLERKFITLKPSIRKVYMKSIT